MGKKSTPKAPDLSGYVDALNQSGEWGYKTAQDQLAWAREQDTMNRELLDKTLAPQLQAQQDQMDWARKDRARYENTYQPLEDNLIQDFQNYGSDERMASDRGRAMADVATSFNAQRNNALQRLESYGVDPSQTRNAALDIGVRTQEAASTAAAGTSAQRIGEDKARALRADAINIGRGLPSQVAQSYGQSVQAGSAAIGGANSTTATAAGAYGGANSFMQTGQAGYTGAANTATQGFNNQMSAYNAQQQANAALYQGIGSAVGMAGSMMMADGGDPSQAIPSQPGKIDYGPGDGSGIDDKVPIMASREEYIVPADVVRAKGVEFFDKLVDRYHTPAAQQRQGIPA
jgi:hypothetical protein